MRRLGLGALLLVLCIPCASAGARSAAAARSSTDPYIPSAPTKGALYADGQSGRYLLGGTWLYRKDSSDAGIAGGWWRARTSTAGWLPVSVPNAYNAGDFSSLSMSGYVGWYRRDFIAPADAFSRGIPRSARHWILRFESVNYNATVWLNGRRIGLHAGAYLPFELALAKLRRGVNSLVVRVDNRRTATDLPPGPGGLWWNYGGILREVYLRAVQRADVSQVQIRPTLRCPHCAAHVEERVIVSNPTTQRQVVSLHGSYGGLRLDFGSSAIAPGASWTASASFAVRRPRLWSIGHPELYHATLALRDVSGRRLQSFFADSGIRSIRVRHGQLELNGHPTRLRGVSLHEQDKQLGAALDPAHVTQLMRWVKATGATVIRSHYPLSPLIEQIADREGILIWSEVPVYQVDSTGLASPQLLARASHILSENIATNQNHPAVLLWSIGNELPASVTASEARYIASASSLAHRLDPTRPVALDISDWKGVACQSPYAPLDVIGANEYYGWFDAGGGATDDRDGLSSFLDAFRACYPKKALFITEFGFDGNRHGPVEERGTYEFQSDSTAYHLGVFASKPWLSGAIYWLLQDFAATPGWAGGNPAGTPPFVQKGLFEFSGAPKPVFSVVSAIYHSTQQLASGR